MNDVIKYATDPTCFAYFRARCLALNDKYVCCSECPFYKDYREVDMNQYIELCKPVIAKFIEEERK